MQFTYSTWFEKMPVTCTKVKILLTNIGFITKRTSCARRSEVKRVFNQVVWLRTDSSLVPTNQCLVQITTSCPLRKLTFNNITSAADYFNSYNNTSIFIFFQNWCKILYMHQHVKSNMWRRMYRYSVSSVKRITCTWACNLPTDRNHHLIVLCLDK